MVDFYSRLSNLSTLWIFYAFSGGLNSYNNPRLLHKGTQRKLYINFRKISQNVVNFEYGNHEIIKEEFDLITNYDLSKSSKTALIQEYQAKRGVLVRTICDFISGMTDTYAINEYNRIVK